MTKTKEERNILTLIKQAVEEVFKEMDVITRDDLEYLPQKRSFLNARIKLWAN